MKNDFLNTKKLVSSIAHRRDHKQSGFGLVEIMVVVAILALLVLFAAPDFMDWKPNIALKRAADQFYTHMQEAKMAAIKTNTSVMLNVTTSACPGGGYTLVDGTGRVVASVTSNDLIWSDPVQQNSRLDVCLQTSGFTNGSSGYNSRGLPANTGANNVTFTQPDSDFTYVITQTPSGGISKVKIKK